MQTEIYRYCCLFDTTFLSIRFASSLSFPLTILVTRTIEHSFKIAFRSIPLFSDDQKTFYLRAIDLFPIRTFDRIFHAWKSKYMHEYLSKINKLTWQNRFLVIEHETKAQCMKKRGKSSFDAIIKFFLFFFVETNSWHFKIYKYLKYTSLIFSKFNSIIQRLIQ